MGKLYLLLFIITDYKAAFNAPCVGHKNDESQAQDDESLIQIIVYVAICQPVLKFGSI